MQKAIYKSKHAFNGSPAQSQLSFVAGATIVAEMGQSGAWWWGRCNGVVSDLYIYNIYLEFCGVVILEYYNVLGGDEFGGM